MTIREGRRIFPTIGTEQQASGIYRKIVEKKSRLMDRYEAGFRQLNIPVWMKTGRYFKMEEAYQFRSRRTNGCKASQFREAILCLKRYYWLVGIDCNPADEKKTKESKRIKEDYQLTSSSYPTARLQRDAYTVEGIWSGASLLEWTA